MTNLENLENLVRQNVRLLEQGRELFEGLEDGLYGKPAPPLALSGAGSHFRHCLDFYACLLRGLASERLDYDRRERDPRLEADAPYALGRAAELIAGLEELAAGALEREDQELCVKAEGTGGSQVRWAASSLERELEFLRSHTVHHYALIAVLLRFHGHEPPADFGVAPSTLHHWKEEGYWKGEANACAP